MPHVLVESGVVVQKQPQEKEGFIKAPDYVVPGYGYSAGEFFRIPPPDPTDEQWCIRIAATRYDHEIAGTTFTHSDGNTYGVGTDRQSQALVTGAAVQAQRNGISKQWKTAQGFVTLTSDDILAMGDAVDAHVQAAFDREAELVAKVADGTITESDLESGWP